MHAAAAIKQSARQRNLSAVVPQPLLQPGPGPQGGMWGAHAWQVRERAAGQPLPGIFLAGEDLQDGQQHIGRNLQVRDR